MSENFDKFFPFAKPRSEQKIAIDFILDSFNLQNKKFVIAELGTGLGKSAIGVTVSRAILDKMESDKTGAYFLTTQKVLQDQYIRDFGPNSLGLMRTIKSSANYTCVFHPNQSCGESRRILQHVRNLSEAKDFVKVCTNMCPYSKEKNAFLQSALSVTSFAYFLSETKYAGKLEPRNLLVIDEAHNIETALSSFIEIIFSEKFSKDILKCNFPINQTQQDVIDWIQNDYLKSLKKIVKKTETTIKKNVSDAEKLDGSSKQYDLLDKHICKVNRFIETYDSKNWIMNIVSNQHKNGKSYKKFEFKPIDVSKFTQEYLFNYADKILIMSATILNKEAFCRSIGLSIDDVAFISIPSPFPIENRPIHYLPIGSMSKSKIDVTLPKMTDVIREILQQHKNQKGMIHAVNYKIAKYLFENLKDSRILIHDSLNREQVLKRHIESPEPTILLSPSMSEGVDLNGDLSRFQVLCKVPFPYLGDLVVKKRMEHDDMWYPYQTAKTIIQSIGRSVRSASDHAVSYILDSDWEYFYSKNKHLFPSDFNKIVQ